MEEKLELKFAQIDKSGLIEFKDTWELTEYNNGAFFLTNEDKALVDKRIIMRNSKEEEVWTSKVMNMKDVFFDENKTKYNYLSQNAINVKNIPNINDDYYIYIEDTEYRTKLTINFKDASNEILIEDINDRSIGDYLKEAVSILNKESKYNFFNNKASVNFVNFNNNKFQFSAVDNNNENIWLEVEYKTKEEENILRDAVNNIKSEFKDLNLVEVNKDEDKLNSMAEIIVKN